MLLEIKLNQSEVELKLLKNRKAIDPVRNREGTQCASASYGVDAQTTKYYHDLSDVLITTLDKLLKRNRLDLKVVKSYKILSDLGKDSTSYKIASAFIQGLKI